MSERMPAVCQHASEKDTNTAGERFLTSLIKRIFVNMYPRTTTLIILLVCILAAGCISSDAPEDLPRLEERVMPTPTPAPALAPAPTRTPVPPVEMTAPEPTPTPTPRNVTTTLCDYPPCGRGGGGGGSGGSSSGGELPDDPICELPTVLLVLVGIGVVAICARKE